MATKLGIIKGFVQGTVWSGKGNSRLMLPFQDTILEAEFSYTGENVMTETFSDGGVLGASAACLQKEACSVTLATEDISWAMLKAATLSESVTRATPVLVTETLTMTGTTATLSYPAVTEATDVTAAGLPTSGVSVADVDGAQLASTVTGATLTVTAAEAGDRLTVQYLREPLAGEETIFLGAGNRIQQVGVYGKFFGCPGSLLVVVPRAVISPNLTFGVSSGSVAKATLELQALRTDGYFAEVTRLKDCVDC